MDERPRDNTRIRAYGVVARLIACAIQMEPIKSLHYRDILHLIPSWRFFAPTPGCRDYHLELEYASEEKPTPIFGGVCVLIRRAIGGARLSIQQKGKKKPSARPYTGFCIASTSMATMFRLAVWLICRSCISCSDDMLINLP